jgi:hypothetical protein
MGTNTLHFGGDMLGISHPAPPHTAIEHIFSDGILAFQRP